MEGGSLNSQRLKLISNGWGFTLIEVLIALSLLSFLGLWTSQSITNAIRSKKKIQKMVDKSGLLRDALQVIQKDINLAFHHYDINVDIYNESQKERIKRCEKNIRKKSSRPPAARGRSPTRPSPPRGSKAPPKNTLQYCSYLKSKFKKKVQKQLTQFQGDPDSLHFTSLSNVRAKRNSKLSRQSEVGYFVKDCKGRLDKTISSPCLWRRVSPFIDNEVSEGGRKTVLLENVTAFELRYLGPEKEKGMQWIKKWKTGENADAVTRGKFPSAVEVKVTLQNKNKDKDKEITMTMVAGISFPNNERLKRKKASSSPSSSPSQRGRAQPPQGARTQ